MKLIFLAGLTNEGYGFIAIWILSFVLAYFWLKPSTENGKKQGCAIIGVVGFIIGCFLMFCAGFSFSLFDIGNKVIQAGVVLFWSLLLGFFVYVIVAKDRAKVQKTIFSIIVKFFVVVAAGLAIFMFGGMIYFIYLRLFTSEKDDTPFWAAYICIFFVAILIFLASGYLIDYNAIHAKKKEKTFFVSLEKAKLKPDSVIELDLSLSKLDTFPIEILQFKNIKFLILSDNNISEIPGDINKLKHLVGFDISRNPISAEEKSRLKALLSPRVELVF